MGFGGPKVGKEKLNINPQFRLERSTEEGLPSDEISTKDKYHATSALLIIYIT
jgi:hypothetical protein